MGSGRIDPGSNDRDPVDPDVGCGDVAAVAAGDRQWDVLAVIAVGGASGALARHGVEVALPRAPGGFPWSTLLINATGCVLIGLLMTVLAHRGTERRLIRPLLGVGVLGGYTTFSTFALDTHRLGLHAQWGTAIGYVLASLICCLAGVWAAVAVSRRLIGAV